MTKKQMIDQLNVVTDQLNKADETSIEHHYDAAKAIGDLIIAIDHLREVVQELVEKKAEA